MSVADRQIAVANRLDRFATAYSVLARVFAEPADADLLAFLAQPGQVDSWPLEARGATAAGLAELRAAVSATPDVEALALDFQLLFIGPGRPHAVPYESVYRGKEGLLFEEPTFAVRRAYEAFGLVVPNLNREPDDHIALEFSFLAHLCLRALDALDAGDDLTVDQCLAGEQAFLDDHALQWMPTMLEAMLAQAETPFYRAFAQLAQGVLADAKLVD